MLSQSKYGSCGRICHTCVDELREAGYKAGLVRPITTNPFPSDAYRKIADKARFILDVEMAIPALMAQDVELAVDERESLLDTLRQRLGLTSVKKGCEVGECGACTVLVNGEAIDSCIYMTLWAEGKSIMTVEGLKGPNGELSPIQKAFIEEAAVQCGFCTPGLIMSAVEIVGTGKKYNREELKKLISGHLCRCTGYENILNAMERIVEEGYQVSHKTGGTD